MCDFLTLTGRKRSFKSHDFEWFQIFNLFLNERDRKPFGKISRQASVTRLNDLSDFGKFLKPLATINLPKSPTFLSKFCKGVKIYHFSSEIIFGQLLQTFGDFFGHTPASRHPTNDQTSLPKWPDHVRKLQVDGDILKSLKELFEKIKI